MGAYFWFYNNLGPHQALGYRIPAEVFYGEPVAEKEELKERRCSDQAVLVSYGAVQESHLIVSDPVQPMGSTSASTLSPTLADFFF